MLFSKCEKEKPKKKHGGTLIVCTLATVGAYAIVSTVKNKMSKMIHGMHKMFKGKSCECEPCPECADEYGMKAE
ncbi:MAG: hypothetical protein IKC72_02250 [Clostridia bacterium]|nr:hypothetical protein [Clostridia bacterium]